MKKEERIAFMIDRTKVTVAISSRLIKASSSASICRIFPLSGS